LKAVDREIDFSGASMLAVTEAQVGINGCCHNAPNVLIRDKSGELGGQSSLGM